MSSEIGKKFNVICENNIQIFAFDIERLDTGEYILDRLDSGDEIVGDNKYKRNFYLKNTVPEGNDILLVTIQGKRIVLNRYILDNKSLKIQKNIANVSYDVLDVTEDYELEFFYKDDMKKPISVIDILKKEELVPACFFNNTDNTIKGKYKLSQNSKYIVLNFDKKSA